MQRTLAVLREQGYQADKVEYWNPFAHRRKDLFGCIDVLAMKQGYPLLAVQVTTGEHGAAGQAKARETARIWHSTGNSFQVWAWRKLKKDGWQPLITRPGDHA